MIGQPEQAPGDSGDRQGSHRRASTPLRGGTDDTVRDSVAARLEHLSRHEGPLDPRGPNESAKRFSTDPNREVVLDRVLAQLVTPLDGVGHDRRCVVVTAGPPSAGKTTEVANLSLGCRVIDADVAKDLLIEEALADGTYDPLLQHVLPDGTPILPRELAGLFHTESTRLAEEALRICTQRREDIIIEGTMRWDGLIPFYLGLLTDEDYRRLEILSCELPLAEARERALVRWWTGRVTALDRGLGGRFVPRRFIEDLYPNGIEFSVCRHNARLMFESAKDQFEDVRLVMAGPGRRAEVAHSASI